MYRSIVHLPATCLTIALLLFAGCSAGDPAAGGATGSDHEALVSLFEEWRAFEMPEFIDGVPDYTAPAMKRQRRELIRYMRRLVSIDTTGWAVPEQVDWWLVRAEMNGLYFYHHVSRPWTNNPAFYVMIFPSRSDVPAHEGPVLHGWIDLWTYDYPLEPGPAAELTGRIAAIPPILEQARDNLTGNARAL